MFEDIPDRGFEDESQWWNYFNSKRLDKELREARLRAADALHAKSYGKVPARVFRMMIALMLEEKSDDDYFRYMHSDYPDAPHPDALKLLIKYGTFYRPFIPKRKWLLGEPVLRRCFQNSQVFMETLNQYLPEKKQLVYVEGIAAGVMSPPMLHAWNAEGVRGRSAVDWTWYVTSRWHIYLGVPLTSGELKDLLKLSGRSSLFSQRSFTPQIGQYIRDRIQARSQ